tara:strand:- start:500 stop:910 length:411 start_codon:yes stop_codon:yes gene_type:complete
MKKRDKIGFVNGCFDVLHIGHIRLLSFANSKCDKLYVAIDSDSKVKGLKGSDRPFNNQDDRREFLLSIKGIQDVFIYDTVEELEHMVMQLSPDIMVVGKEYESKGVVGGEHAKRIIFFSRIGSYSTSKILEGLSHR